jgi:hypothetical protein
VFVVPFRVFSSTTYASALPPLRSSRNQLPVQSACPAEVPPLLVRRSHCTVGRFLGCVVFPQRASLAAVQLPDEPSRRAWPSSRVLQPSNLAGRPQSASTSHGLSVPSAHVRIQGPLDTGFAGPATVRLQGLATLLTAYALESLAGFVSPQQRSWDSPFGALSPTGYPERFRLEAPTYRLSYRCSRRRSDGPARQAAVPGLCPRREARTDRTWV